jgi:Rrf2 family protein
MQFTKAEGYGLHGIMYLAGQPEGRVTPLSEISAEQRVPEKFLAKIFQNLSKSELVTSHRGVKGGFSLAKPADKMTVREVLESIQGPYYLAKCIEDESICDRADRCAIKQLLSKAQDNLRDLFGAHTIAELVSWETTADTETSQTTESG